MGGARRGGGLRALTPPEAQLKVVDYLLVPRYRHSAHAQQAAAPAPAQAGMPAR